MFNRLQDLEQGDGRRVTRQPKATSFASSGLDQPIVGKRLQQFSQVVSGGTDLVGDVTSPNLLTVRGGLQHDHGGDSVNAGFRNHG